MKKNAREYERVCRCRSSASLQCSCWQIAGLVNAATAKLNGVGAGDEDEKGG